MPHTGTPTAGTGGLISGNKGLRIKFSGCEETGRGPLWEHSDKIISEHTYVHPDSISTIDVGIGYSCGALVYLEEVAPEPPCDPVTVIQGMVSLIIPTAFPAISFWCFDVIDPNPPTLVITFSNPIDPATVIDANFFFTEVGSGIHIPGTIGQNSATEYTFTPSAPLPISIREMHMTAGIRTPGDIVHPTGCPITPLVWEVAPTFCT